jgi:hypothetical protein
MRMFEPATARSRLLGVVSLPLPLRMAGFAGDSQVAHPAESRVSLSAEP